MRKVHGRLAALSALVVAATGLTIAGVSAVAQAGCDKGREITINDIAVAEGTAPESGPVTWFTFKVHSAGCAEAGELSFSVLHETTDDKDLRLSDGKIAFDKGDLSGKEISVPVYADSEDEQWEKFVVLLHSPTRGIRFCKDFAIAQIANDDGDARGKPIVFPSMEPRCELHKSR
ncbi:hypothetical protein F4553_002137 [Allocatelliglobosispora scoriae]|uniref:Calx-beta domain-containing protein n=1 Tax=Allocatelliglobosispora scoriae TaxID=643052 RepID=A0A841BN01_9ACTN|nr:hypothetical protein [Allocatelliglobosispora scoriae]MBB5868758.1 hypothetical protein [Allocatelliglobosispora scoriae]